MNEVYIALYNRLTDQLSYNVYDHIPQDEPYPFVSINPLNIDTDDTDADKGYNATIDIIAFDDYRGIKNVSTMNQAIYDALHRYVMADTTTYAFVTIHREFNSIVTESNGITRQGISRFRIIFENKPIEE